MHEKYTTMHFLCITEIKMPYSTITHQQIKAARSLLDWTQDDLAERCGLSKYSIVNVESGKTAPQRATLDSIIDALEAAGIEFMDGGVRKKADSIRVLSGDDANEKLLEEIFATIKNSGEEILIFGLREPSIDNTETYNFVSGHISRIKSVGITERILIEEGDKNFIAPQEWYRWLPKKYFSPHTFQLFGNKLALINWGPPQQIIIIDNKLFADSYRNFFNFSWDNAISPKE